MGPLDSAIWFGGLVISHAAWIASDIEEGSLLCPFAIIQTGDERRVVAFESESHAKSVQQGKASLSEYRDTADFWGFARDGLLAYPESAQQEVDVLTVSSWGQGLDEPVILRQRYMPKKRGRFKLLGSIEIAVHGLIVPEPAQTSFRSLAISGVESHPRGVLWQNWTSM